MSLIKLSNVTVKRGTTNVLENINFSINQNDYIGIIGPNGGGKTTLLKTIIGDITPTSGKITYKPNISIGYVPQFASFSNKFPITVFETILSGTLPNKIKFFHKYSAKDKKSVFEIMEKLKIECLTDKHIGKLSGGQLQKVLLARALVTNPNLLLLDEPTASLDTNAKKDIYDILNTLQKEVPIILVSHDIGIVKHSVNTIACINKSMHIHPDKNNIKPWHFENLFY